MLVHTCLHDESCACAQISDAGRRDHTPTSSPQTSKAHPTHWHRLATDPFFVTPWPYLGPSKYHSRWLVPNDVAVAASCLLVVSRSRHVKSSDVKTSLPLVCQQEAHVSSSIRQIRAQEARSELQMSDQSSRGQIRGRTHLHTYSTPSACRWPKS